jgi:hypothetical protein
MRTLQDAANPADRKLVQDVARVGWHVTMVAESGGEPAYGYTVGLFATHQRPELVVFGPPPEAIHEMLNALGTLAANGEALADGGRYELFEDGRKVAFAAFPPAEYDDYLESAVWFYEGAEFPALQVLWPDSRGKYPTDAEFDRRLRPQQPLPGRSEPILGRPGPKPGQDGARQKEDKR